MRVRVATAVVLVAGLLTWTGPAVFAADPSRVSTVPTATQVTASAEQTRTVDLYRSGAAVTQYTSYWCVPASAQTMLNVIRGTTDRTRYNQSRYAWHIQRFNRYTYASRGNDPRGWARFMDTYVAGDWHYADRIFGSQTDSSASPSI